MINEPYTEYLPQVRCPASLKARLERVAEGSVARNLTDHIRFAVERYVAQEEARSSQAAAWRKGQRHERGNPTRCGIRLWGQHQTAVRRPPAPGTERHQDEPGQGA